MSFASECRILVADDDMELRGALVDCLLAEGFQVLEAADGEQALKVALEQQPQVVLLDHRMPGILGAEVARQLKQHRLQTRIVLITAAREGAELAAQAGVDAFLRKPFELDSCLNILRESC